MQIKSNEVVKAIRTKRGILLSAFAFMLEISPTYLSFMENGERKLKPQIIGKILNIVGDLSQSEKEELLAIKKEIEGPTFQKTQNQIMKLICEFFSQIKNKAPKEILEAIGDKITSLIKQLIPEYMTNEMAPFACV